MSVRSRCRLRYVKDRPISSTHLRSVSVRSSMSEVDRAISLEVGNVVSTHLSCFMSDSEDSSVSHTNTNSNNAICNETTNDSEVGACSGNSKIEVNIIHQPSPETEVDVITLLDTEADSAARDGVSLGMKGGELACVSNSAENWDEEAETLGQATANEIWAGGLEGDADHVTANININHDNDRQFNPPGRGRGRRVSVHRLAILDYGVPDDNGGIVEENFEFIIAMDPGPPAGVVIPQLAQNPGNILNIQGTNLIRGQILETVPSQGQIQGAVPFQGQGIVSVPNQVQGTVSSTEEPVTNVQFHAGNSLAGEDRSQSISSLPAGHIGTISNVNTAGLQLIPRNYINVQQDSTASAPTLDHSVDILMETVVSDAENSTYLQGNLAQEIQLGMSDAIYSEYVYTLESHLVEQPSSHDDDTTADSLKTASSSLRQEVKISLPSITLDLSPATILTKRIEEISPNLISMKHREYPEDKDISHANSAACSDDDLYEDVDIGSAENDFRSLDFALNKELTSVDKERTEQDADILLDQVIGGFRDKEMGPNCVQTLDEMNLSQNYGKEYELPFPGVNSDGHSNDLETKDFGDTALFSDTLVSASYGQMVSTEYFGECNVQSNVKFIDHYTYISKNCESNVHLMADTNILNIAGVPDASAKTTTDHMFDNLMLKNETRNESQVVQHNFASIPGILNTNDDENEPGVEAINEPLVVDLGDENNESVVQSIGVVDVVLSGAISFTEASPDDSRDTMPSSAVCNNEYSITEVSKSRDYDNKKKRFAADHNGVLKKDHFQEEETDDKEANESKENKAIQIIQEYEFHKLVVEVSNVMLHTKNRDVEHLRMDQINAPDHTDVRVISLKHVGKSEQHSESEAEVTVTVNNINLTELSDRIQMSRPLRCEKDSTGENPMPGEMTVQSGDDEIYQTSKEKTLCMDDLFALETGNGSKVFGSADHMSVSDLSHQNEKAVTNVTMFPYVLDRCGLIVNDLNSSGTSNEQNRNAEQKQLFFLSSEQLESNCQYPDKQINVLDNSLDSQNQSLQLQERTEKEDIHIMEGTDEDMAQSNSETSVTSIANDIKNEAASKILENYVTVLKCQFPDKNSKESHPQFLCNNVDNDVSNQAGTIFNQEVNKPEVVLSILNETSSNPTPEISKAIVNINASIDSDTDEVSEEGNFLLNDMKSGPEVHESLNHENQKKAVKVCCHEPSKFDDSNYFAERMAECIDPEKLKSHYNVGSNLQVTICHESPILVKTEFIFGQGDSVNRLPKNFSNIDETSELGEKSKGKFTSIIVQECDFKEDIEGSQDFKLSGDDDLTSSLEFESREDSYGECDTTIETQTSTQLNAETSSTSAPLKYNENLSSQNDTVTDITEKDENSFPIICKVAVDYTGNKKNVQIDDGSSYKPSRDDNYDGTRDETCIDICDDNAMEASQHIASDMDCEIKNVRETEIPLDMSSATILPVGDLPECKPLSRESNIAYDVEEREGRKEDNIIDNYDADILGHGVGRDIAENVGHEDVKVINDTTKGHDDAFNVGHDDVDNIDNVVTDNMYHDDADDKCHDEVDNVDHDVADNVGQNDANIVGKDDITTGHDVASLIVHSDVTVGHDYLNVVLHDVDNIVDGTRPGTCSPRQWNYKDKSSLPPITPSTSLDQGELFNKLLHLEKKITDQHKKKDDGGVLISVSEISNESLIFNGDLSKSKTECSSMDRKADLELIMMTEPNDGQSFLLAELNVVKTDSTIKKEEILEVRFNSEVFEKEDKHKVNNECKNDNGECLTSQPEKIAYESGEAMDENGTINTTPNLHHSVRTKTKSGEKHRSGKNKSTLHEDTPKQLENLYLFKDEIGPTNNELNPTFALANNEYDTDKCGEMCQKEEMVHLPDNNDEFKTKPEDNITSSDEVDSMKNETLSPPKELISNSKVSFRSSYSDVLVNDPSSCSLAHQQASPTLTCRSATEGVAHGQLSRERVSLGEICPVAKVILDATDIWLSRISNICQSSEAPVEDPHKLQEIAQECSSQLVALTQSSEICQEHAQNCSLISRSASKTQITSGSVKDTKLNLSRVMSPGYCSSRRSLSKCNSSTSSLFEKNKLCVYSKQSSKSGDGNHSSSSTSTVSCSSRGSSNTVGTHGRYHKTDEPNSPGEPTQESLHRISHTDCNPSNGFKNSLTSERPRSSGYSQKSKLPIPSPKSWKLPPNSEGGAAGDVLSFDKVASHGKILPVIPINKEEATSSDKVNSFSSTNMSSKQCILLEKRRQPHPPISEKKEGQRNVFKRAVVVQQASRSRGAVDQSKKDATNVTATKDVAQLESHAPVLATAARMALRNAAAHRCVESGGRGATDGQMAQHSSPAVSPNAAMADRALTPKAHYLLTIHKLRGLSSAAKVTGDTASSQSNIARLSESSGASKEQVTTPGSKTLPLTITAVDETKDDLTEADKKEQDQDKLLQRSRQRVGPLKLREQLTNNKAKCAKILTMQEFDRIQADRHLNQAFARIQSSKPCVDCHMDAKVLDKTAASVQRKREKVNHDSLIALENIKFLEMLRFKKSAYDRDEQLKEFKNMKAGEAKNNRLKQIKTAAIV